MSGCTTCWFEDCITVLKTWCTLWEIGCLWCTLWCTPWCTLYTLRKIGCTTPPSLGVGGIFLCNGLQRPQKLRLSYYKTQKQLGIEPNEHQTPRFQGKYSYHTHLTENPTETQFSVLFRWLLHCRFEIHGPFPLGQAAQAEGDFRQLVQRGWFSVAGRSSC